MCEKVLDETVKRLILKCERYKYANTKKLR